MAIEPLVRVVTTPQLMSLMDTCEAHGVDLRVPEEYIPQLDAEGRHVLITGDLVTECRVPSMPDLVVAHVAFKFINTPAEAEPGLWYIEVPEDVWQQLPVHE